MYGTYRFSGDEKLMKDRYIPHFRKLRYIEFGSMPMPAEQKRELAEQLPSPVFVCALWLTEVAANIFTEFHDDIDYLDTLGKPSPNVDVAIMNESMISLPNERLVKLRYVDPYKHLVIGMIQSEVIRFW